MKKVYTTPEIKITALESADIITLSSVASKAAGALNSKSSSEIDF